VAPLFTVIAPPHTAAGVALGADLAGADQRPVVVHDQVGVGVVAVGDVGVLGGAGDGERRADQRVEQQRQRRAVDERRRQAELEHAALQAQGAGGARAGSVDAGDRADADAGHVGRREQDPLVARLGHGELGRDPQAHDQVAFAGRERREQHAQLDAIGAQCIALDELRPRVVHGVARRRALGRRRFGPARAAALAAAADPLQREPERQRPRRARHELERVGAEARGIGRGRAMQLGAGRGEGDRVAVAVLDPGSCESARGAQAEGRRTEDSVEHGGMGA
jgi:hypothetical protein